MKTVKLLFRMFFAFAVAVGLIALAVLFLVPPVRAADPPSRCDCVTTGVCTCGPSCQCGTQFVSAEADPFPTASAYPAAAGGNGLVSNYLTKNESAAVDRAAAAAGLPVVVYVGTYTRQVPGAICYAVDFCRCCTDVSCSDGVCVFANEYGTLLFSKHLPASAGVGEIAAAFYRSAGPAADYRGQTGQSYNAAGCSAPGQPVGYSAGPMGGACYGGNCGATWTQGGPYQGGGCADGSCSVQGGGCAGGNCGAAAGPPSSRGIFRRRG